MRNHVSLPSRAMVARLATFAGAALAGAAFAAPGEFVATNAVLPVTSIELRTDLTQGAVVTGVRTPFGVTPVRPAQFVASRFNWDSQQADLRAPRAIYDLDFNTTIDADPEQAQPVEAAVLLSPGLARLAPGPDAFVFVRTKAVSGVRVAPLLRDDEGHLSKGDEVVLDTDRDLAPVSIDKDELFGFGVDLDAWVQRGRTPAGTRVVGLVITHDGAPGTGSLAIAEIIASDAPLFSQGGGAGSGGGYAEAFSIGGGFGNGGGGGGGGNDDGEEEVPTPGVGLVLGVGMALAASRRRR